MRIHAILDRAVFKTGENCDVDLTIYDADGRPFTLRNTDLITINAKRWIDSTESLLDNVSCDITNATYGECSFPLDIDTSSGLGRYLAEITLQRIVGTTAQVYKSSDITMWIDRGL